MVILRYAIEAMNYALRFYFLVTFLLFSYGSLAICVLFVFGPA